MVWKWWDKKGSCSEVESLRQLAARGYFRSVEKMLKCMLPVADQLQYYHEKSLIYGAVTPDTIVLHGNALCLAASGTRLAGGRDMAGAMEDHYSPAEQWNKEAGRLGAWSDIYALCAVMYEMVTGIVPDSSMQRLLLDEIRRPSELGIELPSGVEEMIMKGLSLEPGERFQTVQELKDCIWEILKRRRRNRSIGKRIVLAAAGCVLLFVLANGIKGYNERKDPFYNAETQTVVLKLSEDMPEDEYEAWKKKCEDKLEIICGETAFRVKTRSDKALEITTFYDVYEGTGCKALFEPFFSELFYPVVYTQDSQTGDVIIEKLDLEKVTNISLLENQISGMETEYSLKLKVEPEIYAALAGKYEGCSDVRLVLNAWMLLEDNYYYVELYFDEEDESILLKADIQQEAEWNLLMYELSDTSERVQAELQCEILADWEEVKTKTLYCGDYQCSVDQVPDPSITIEYRPVILFSDINESSWIEILTDFKVRLDALKQPYAIGRGRNDSTHIVVKTTMKNMDQMIADTLGRSYQEVKLVSSWKSMGQPDTIESLENDSKDGHRIKLDYSQGSYAEQLYTFTEDMLDDGYDELYLKIGTYYIAKTQISEPLETAAVYFDQIGVKEPKNIAEENECYTDYLIAFAEQSKLDDIDMKLCDMVCTESDGRITSDTVELPQRFDLGMQETVTEKIERAYPQTEVVANDHDRSIRSVEISIYQKEEDTSYEEILELIKGIYETGQLENGYYDSVYFRFYPDKGEAETWLWMSMDKRGYTDDEDPNSYQLYYGLTDTESENSFKSLMEKDEFFVEMLS